MNHAIHRVTGVEVTGPHQVRVSFADGTLQQIDFSGVLEGELFGPLKDPAFFRQVRVDPEVETLVWPNGADFDPATLHDWPLHAEAFRQRAQEWACQPA
ncbi:MAG: DUF2442 domain-containing protein [Limisphaerales bacterium]